MELSESCPVASVELSTAIRAMPLSRKYRNSPSTISCVEEIDENMKPAFAGAIDGEVQYVHRPVGHERLHRTARHGDRRTDEDGRVLGHHGVHELHRILRTRAVVVEDERDRMPLDPAPFILDVLQREEHVVFAIVRRTLPGRSSRARR